MHKNIHLIRADITQQAVDVIVNAANSSLMGGGGVDGAIHRAGGPEILEQCKNIVARQGRLPTGQAVMTTAGNMPARHVIHTVGPIWYGGERNETKLLEKAYQNSLILAYEHNLKTIAFPSISTGAYRFPLDRAAFIALQTVNRFLREHSLDEVRFILFSQHDLDIYSRTADEMEKLSN